MTFRTDAVLKRSLAHRLGVLVQSEGSRIEVNSAPTDQFSGERPLTVRMVRWQIDQRPSGAFCIKVLEEAVDVFRLAVRQLNVGR